MLSQSDTISDVKAKLENDYSSFGYASDALFTVGLESTAFDVMLTYFYPRIGKTAYDIIALKDNVGLTEYESYLYWAEIYTICNEFLKWYGAKSTQTSSNNLSESLTVEGYTYKTSSGSSASNESGKSLKYYYGMLSKYWSLAGMNAGALERTCNVFGNSDPDPFGGTIINVDGVISTI